MRYYVVCKSDIDSIAPHIVAEFVRDRSGDDRDATLASALAGEHRVFATRGEILEHALGREALALWDAEDDSVFEDECATRRAGTVTPLRGLRLVKSAPAE